ncbi:MAG: hypothetical protein ABI818_13375 [Acidobacteriota bacterium]
MRSDSEHRNADLFFADLMGVSRPRLSLGGRGRRPGSNAQELAEQASGWEDLKSGRVVFYDEDTLGFIEGWTRASQSDDVFLVNRGAFDPIRIDARRRSREFDSYLRRTLSGKTDLQAPLYVIDSSLHTAPLSPGAAGDWDDLMISRLIAAARPLSIQGERDQWKMIRGLFDSAVQDARNAGSTQKPAREFVAYFVLETVRGTLRMVKAANVTMNGNHANIPLGRIHSTKRPVLPGGDAGQRVIGDVHTHVLLDPLIDTSSTALRTTVRDSTTSLHNGVSDVDVASARADRIVVYAVDSKWLHRANPNGTKNDKLPRSGNVLREALRISGGEPR